MVGIGTGVCIGTRTALVPRLTRGAGYMACKVVSPGLAVCVPGIFSGDPAHLMPCPEAPAGAAEKSSQYARSRQAKPPCNPCTQPPALKNLAPQFLQPGTYPESLTLQLLKGKLLWKLQGKEVSMLGWYVAGWDAMCATLTSMVGNIIPWLPLAGTWQTTFGLQGSY